MAPASRSGETLAAHALNAALSKTAPRAITIGCRWARAKESMSNTIAHKRDAAAAAAASVRAHVALIQCKYQLPCTGDPRRIRRRARAKRSGAAIAVSERAASLVTYAIVVS
jgi:hypothetical protein